MKGLGPRETYRKVMSANGPAQLLTYSFWGILMAGMFNGVCCISTPLLIAWGTVSLLILPATIWASTTTIRNLVLLDVLISAYILAIFTLHEPHVVAPVYYSFDGAGIATARDTGQTHGLSDWFHASALIWMTAHALYLADLLNRQILEKKRFSA